MIHKTLNELILSFGGIHPFSREMGKHGVSVTGGSVRKWYSSDKVQPHSRYHETIMKLAEMKGMKVQIFADGEK